MVKLAMYPALLGDPGRYGAPLRNGDEIGLPLGPRSG
jgi:hypothetical protein